jgi:hypothetical protein
MPFSLFSYVWFRSHTSEKLDTPCSIYRDFTVPLYRLQFELFLVLYFYLSDSKCYIKKWMKFRKIGKFETFLNQVIVICSESLIVPGSLTRFFDVLLISKSILFNKNNNRFKKFSDTHLIPAWPLKYIIKWTIANVTLEANKSSKHNSQLDNDMDSNALRPDYKLDVPEHLLIVIFTRSALWNALSLLTLYPQRAFISFSQVFNSEFSESANLVTLTVEKKANKKKLLYG